MKKIIGMLVLIIPLNLKAEAFTLKKALEISLEGNPEIKSSYENLRKVHSKVFSSFLPPNPKITYQAMFMENNLGIGQPLPFPTKLVTKGLMANDEYRKFYYLYQTKTLEILRKVKESFYDYFLAHKKIEIARKQIELLEKMKLIAKKRYEAGISKIWDLLKAEIELEKMKNNLLIFEAEKIKYEESLKTLLNIDSLPGTPEEVKSEGIEQSPDSLRKLLENQNPLLKAMKFDVKARGKEKSIAIQSLIPDFMPQILYNIETGEERFALSFEIPLFFIHEIGKIREKSAKVKSSEFNLKNIKLKLKENLNSLLSVYKAKLDRYLLFKNTILPKTEESFKSAETGYITGKFDFLTYIETEKMLFDAEIGYFTSLTDVLKIKAKIEELTGGVK